MKEEKQMMCESNGEKGGNLHHLLGLRNVVVREEEGGSLYLEEL